MRKSLRGMAVAAVLVLPVAASTVACGSDDKPTKPAHSANVCWAGVLIGEESDGDLLYDTDNDGFVNCELDLDGEVEWLDDTKSAIDFPKLKKPKASTSAPATPKASQPSAPPKSAKPTPAKPAPKQEAPKQEEPKKLDPPKKADPAPADPSPAPAKKAPAKKS